MLEKSVGVVVVVRTIEGLKVALQKRGEKDSFPRAFQMTAHGKVKRDEDFFPALMRECSEELGESFTLYFLVTTSIVKLIYQISNDNKEIWTYGILVPEISLDIITIEKTSGGIVLVEACKFFDGSVINITPNKKQSVYPKGVIAMFPDEIQAVKKALDVFG